MKIALSFACITLVACGGSRPAKGPARIGYDPELFELCVTDSDSAEDAPACAREDDGTGRMTWKFPLAATPEFKRVRGLREKGHDGPQIVSLYRNLIRRPVSYRCGGNEEACAKMRREVACEAEIARTELVRMAAGRPELAETAFREVAVIVRRGPSHYRYEDVPGYLRRLRPFLPQGATEVCLAHYRAPVPATGRDPHWKPYTEDDPAPKW